LLLAGALCVQSVSAAQKNPSSGAAPTSPSAPTASVTAIRFWTLSNSTRIAVEVSEEVKFRFEKLSNPDRLAVDLSDSRMRLGEKAMNVVKIGDKLVKQVRVAQREPRVTRVVLDLEGPVEQEISLLSNPVRVLIEIRTAGPKKPSTEVTEAPAPPRPEEAPKTESAKRAKPEPARREPTAPEYSKPASGAESKAESAKRTRPEPVRREPAAPDSPKPAAEAPKTEIAKAEPVKTEEPAAAEPVIPPSSGEPNETPQPAKPNTGGRRSLTRALGLKVGRVVLDAGHGGHDHGTTGPTGLAEKELVLDVTLRLGALIEQRMGAEVIYTRSTDVFIPLEERPAIANRNKADLFLSIHANASTVRNISGAEVYYLNFTTSRESMDVAARENAGHGKSVSELRELIQRIALSDKLDESRDFAARVQSSLFSTWTKMTSNTRNRGVKKAPFVVLIGASMPSVLAEIGFISNPRDEAMLRKPDQRQRLAEALFKGIQQYAASLGQTQALADSSVHAIRPDVSAAK
jgi:N-acetylmuramoyl-L-alanine amidase